MTATRAPMEVADRMAQSSELTVAGLQSSGHSPDTFADRRNARHGKHHDSQAEQCTLR